jgi:hypothetical protein
MIACVMSRREQLLLERGMGELAQAWSQTSYRMQRLRDHPECADEEYAALGDWAGPGLKPRLSFDPRPQPRVLGGARPGSRSCASRVSTASAKWRAPSWVPASRPLMCT